MHTLSPTKLQKKKLRDMVKHLFPTYKYVSINNNGTVSLRVSFWWYIFFKVKKISLTELCLVDIPEKLGSLRTKKGEYEQIFNEYGHIALDLIQLGKAEKVIDYLYDMYVNVKYNIKRNFYIKNNILPERKFQPFKCSEAIVLSPLSPRFVKDKLKGWSNISSHIKHPKLHNNYINLWFKDEVKKQLNKIFELQASLSYSF